MFRKVHSFLILPLLDLIFPPVCLTCDKRLPERSAQICGECRDSLTQVGAGHPVLREILARFEAGGCVSDVTSCFLFEKSGIMKDIIYHLKYGGMTLIGIELGKMLGRKILDDERLDPLAVLVPVPLHRLRCRDRGYNQSESICLGVASITGTAVMNDLLIRKSNTRSQTKLTLEERRENVREAFALNEKCGRDVRGAAVILVDDVITTGSTIEACARTLLAAGAARVSAASIALAEQKNAAPSPSASHAPM